MFEIHVDVGRFVPFGRNEALEQKVHPVRIDRCDAQHEADRGIGGAAASLAENGARPGVLDDVPDGEEVGRVTQFRDEFQFVDDLRAHLFGNAAGITPRSAFPRQALQRGLRTFALLRAGDLARIFVAQLVERERDASDDLQRALDRIGISREQPRHFGGRLQSALGIRRQQPARFGDTGFLAHASEHVGQDLPLRHMVMHVVDRHERHVHFARQFGQQGQAVFAPRAVKPRGGEIGPVRCMRRERGEVGAERRRQILRRHDDENLALAFGDDVGQRQMAFTFPGAAISARQQPAKPSVRQAIHRVTDRLETVGGHQPRADQETQALLLCHGVGADDACQRVAVRDADGGEA